VNLKKCENQVCIFPNLVETTESEVKSQLANAFADLNSNTASLLLDDIESPDLERIEKLLNQALEIYESADANLKIGECLVSLGMVRELKTGDGSIEYERACGLFEAMDGEDLPEQFREFLIEYRESELE
jgi:hypothetical protein